MRKYKLVYLVWLLPAYLLFLTVHQISVYGSLGKTFEEGASYEASVLEFEINTIASQTNGYIVLLFETDTGEQIQRKLSLPVELAGLISEMSQIPIRYREGALTEVVLLPAYEQHRRMVLSNIAIAFAGLLITLGIAWVSHRYARRKLEKGEETIVIERVD